MLNLFVGRRANSAPGSAANLEAIREDEDELESGTSSSGGSESRSTGRAESLPAFNNNRWQPNIYQKQAAIPNNNNFKPPTPPMNHQWHNGPSGSNKPPHQSQHIADQTPKKIEIITPTEIRFSDLAFVSLIGEGGFGKVWLAAWNGLRVAVKVAVPKGGSESSLLKEFQSEVATMSCMPPHDNILRLRGVCTQPPNLAIISDFCPKGSLYHALHTPGTPGPTKREMLGMWLSIAKGMAHLHHHRILHRDLKSANVLLDDAWQVRICDFGLSKAINQQGHQAQAMTGCLGTFQWMAPEVLMSQKSYTDRADVFSFAIVMWECLTRRLPYASNGMTAMAAGLQVATQGLRPEIPFGTDHSISTLIRQCWAAVPDQRPAFSSIVARLEGTIQSLDHPMAMLPRAPEETTCHITAVPKPLMGSQGLSPLPPFPPTFAKIPPPPLAHPPAMQVHLQLQKETSRPMINRQGMGSSLWGGRGRSDSILPL